MVNRRAIQQDSAVRCNQKDEQCEFEKLREVYPKTLSNDLQHCEFNSLYPILYQTGSSVFVQSKEFVTGIPLFILQINFDFSYASYHLAVSYFTQSRKIA